MGKTEKIIDNTVHTDGSGLGNEISTLIAPSSSTPINVTGTLDGSFAIVGTDLVATNVIGSVSNGFSATGSIVTNDRFTLDGILTPTNGYADGDNYLKTTASGTVTSTEYKPSFGELPILVEDADGADNVSTTIDTPLMTANSTGGYVVSNSISASTAYALFDRSSTADSLNNATGWYKVQPSVAKAYNKVTIQNHDNSGASIRTFRVTASNSGSFSGEEVILYTSSVLSAWATGERRTFTWINSTEYSYYRIELLSPQSGSVYQLQEIEFIESQAPTLLYPDYYLNGLWYNYNGVVYDPQVSYLSENGKLVKVTASGGSPSVITLTDDAPSIVEKCIQVDKAIFGNINVSSLETADPLILGEVWNNSGVLTISAGA